MVNDQSPPAAASLPDAWPVSAASALALTRMGSFDWDLDTGRMSLDDPALAVFDLRPDEYDTRPESLAVRLPPDEGRRLDELVARAIKSGQRTYGAYFRIRRRDGTLRWTHTQGTIQRAPDGRPHRVVGIVRDATDELRHATERELRRAERDRRHTVTEQTTAALARARSVREVLSLLRSPDVMDRLGASGISLGLVEGTRIHVVAERQEGGEPAPELVYSKMDDVLPMSEAASAVEPRFIVSRDEFRRRYPRLWPHIRPLDVTAGAYLPLVAQGRVIGVVALFYPDKQRFSADERHMLVVLGGSIAQSLSSAMLIEHDHEMAQDLQRAMLPRRIPHIPGLSLAVRYRPARSGRDIGGDWYDAIPLPGGRVGAVVGDVQGHDTHAAAVMGQLRIVLRAYASEGHDAGTIMQRASAFLRDLDTERFATCVYVEADPARGRLRLVRAGHISPLLLHADGTCRQVDVSGALPLGLSADFHLLEYPVTSLELAPGDTLLLFTDGLVEEPGTDLETGIARLARLAEGGPRDIDRLADALCRQTGRGEDDLALMLLRRDAASTGRLSHPLRHRVVPGDPQSLSQARRLIRAVAHGWGVAEDCVDNVELVTDELLTNALLHSGGGAQVTVRRLTGADRRLRVEVQDGSSRLPRVREAGDGAVSGRGLHLVDLLTEVWGVEARGVGKVVWCEFRCSGRGET